MFRHICFSTVILVLCLSSTSSAQAVGGAGSGENPWSDNSRDPFEVRMSGFLNTKPADDSIAVVTFGIPAFQGTTYQFEVVEIDAPHFPQMSTRMILQKMPQRIVDFSLRGPRDLLSKIGQAEPGTPLKIVGMYEQRGQRLRLLSVEEIGF